MPAPLSLGIRRRFQRCIENGLSGREAARRLMISPATGARLAKQVRSGARSRRRNAGARWGGANSGRARTFFWRWWRTIPTSPCASCRGRWLRRKACMSIRRRCRAPWAASASHTKTVAGRRQAAKVRCRPRPGRLDKASLACSAGAALRAGLHRRNFRHDQHDQDPRPCAQGPVPERQRTLRKMEHPDLHRGPDRRRPSSRPGSSPAR